MNAGCLKAFIVIPIILLSFFFVILGLGFYGFSLAIIGATLAVISPDYRSWLKSQRGFKSRLSKLPGMASDSPASLAVATAGYLLPISALVWYSFEGVFVQPETTVITALLGLIGVGIIYGWLIQGWGVARQPTDTPVKLHLSNLTASVRQNRNATLLMLLALVLPVCSGIAGLLVFRDSSSLASTATPPAVAVATQPIAPIDTPAPIRTLRPTATKALQAQVANTQIPQATATQLSATATPNPTDTQRPTATHTLAPTRTLAPQPAATLPPPTVALPTDTPIPLPTNTEAAPAPADVRITFILADGVVPSVESDEYAAITNQGGTTINLSGWRLNAGDDRQNFFFPSFDLQPGQSCRVYTNESHPESCGFSFGSGSALWNNGGDCGYLFDANGSEVSRYCY